MRHNRTGQLRRLVAGRSRAIREGVSVESMDLEGAEAMRLGADDVVGRVEATLDEVAKLSPDEVAKLPPDEVGDPGEFRRAMNILLRGEPPCGAQAGPRPEGPAQC